MTASTKIAKRAAQLLSLEGKIAVVTGAGSGIGRGICLRLAEMGAYIAALDIDQGKARETVALLDNRASSKYAAQLTAKSAKASRSSRRTAHLQARAIALRCDVRVTANCRSAVANTVQEWGRIDILCNCAGIAIRKDIVELTEEEWDRALDVTLKGIYLLSHEVIPHMIRDGGGSIINIG